jgi:hypothetical protein
MWKPKMTFKDLIDGAAVAAGVGVIAEIIPIIIGLLTIIWAVYRIYDLHLAVLLKKQQLKE